MIDMIMKTTIHKIYDHAEDKEDIMECIASMLETPRDKINLYVGRCFLYPMMKNVRPVTYDKAWQERYPNVVKLPEEDYRSVYQVWTVPMWCKPTIGSLQLGYTPRRWKTRNPLH
jgi:hypothetical protein